MRLIETTLVHVTADTLWEVLVEPSEPLDEYIGVLYSMHDRRILRIWQQPKTPNAKPHVVHVIGLTAGEWQRLYAILQTLEYT